MRDDKIKLFQNDEMQEEDLLKLIMSNTSNL